MNEEFIEILSDKEADLMILMEEKSKNGNILANFRYTFAVGDRFTANNTFYPVGILIREISKMRDRIKESGVVGQLNHPIQGNTELDKISHLITDVDFDVHTKKAVATSAVLNTNKGRDLMVLLNSDVKLGSSMRGRGSTSADGVVQDDYSLETIDIVLSPSFGKDVEISKANLIESGNQYFEKRTHLTEEQIRERYNNALWQYDFKGSLKEYKEQILNIKE